MGDESESQNDDLKMMYNNMINIQHSDKRMIDTRILYQITVPAVNQQLYSQAWQSLKKKYILSSQVQTLSEIEQNAEKLNQKFAKDQSSHKTPPNHLRMETWGFGELKIFQTVCMVYSLLHSIQLHLFAEPQYIYLCKIFIQKTENFIKYEVTSLIKSKVKNNTDWKKTQIDLFTKIVDSDQHFSKKDAHNLDQYQWRYYSFQMFCRSKGKYYRTLQQCREKWINHLNPELNRAPWDIQEDIQLFELIGQLGYKWAAIAKTFGLRRTEHMVKNRFNSLAKIWKNKETKNIPAKQISQKVLDLLHKKLAEGKPLQKKQIANLFKPSSPSPINSQTQTNNCNQEKIEVKPSEPEKVECEKKQIYEEDYVNEYHHVQEAADKGITVGDWSSRFESTSYQSSKNDKEEKKTWDSQIDFSSIQVPKTQEKSNAQNANKDVIQVKGLQAFDFQLYEPRKYLREGFGNNGLSQILGCQHIQSDQSWLLQLQEKDICSWLD